jgi:hypothetical protein
MKTPPIHPSRRKAEGERDILKQRMERRFSSSDLPEKPGFNRKFGSFRFLKRGFNAKSMPFGADGTETSLRSKSTHSMPKSKKCLAMHASFLSRFLTTFLQSHGQDSSQSRRIFTVLPITCL